MPAHYVRAVSIEVTGCAPSFVDVDQPSPLHTSPFLFSDPSVDSRMPEEPRSSMTTGCLSPYFKPRPMGPAPHQPPIQKPPLLMQRPQSFELDTAGFFFAKPAAAQKAFSLRPPPKPGLITLNSTWSARTVEDQSKNDGQGSQQIISNGQPARPVLELQRPRTGKDTQPDPDPSWTSGFSHEKPLKAIAEIPILEKAQLSNPTYGPKVRADTVLLTGPSTGFDTEADTSRASSAQPPHNGLVRLTSETSVPLTSQPSICPSNDNRVAKRRRQPLKNDPPSRKSSFSNTTSFKMQSEERLFKLLIEKIRQREEQEAATSELQCQLEGQNLRLKDENQNLKQQLEVDNEKLQKTVAESKACRTQMDQWKEKLRRFKDVVNDLGKEYDTLRDELDKFKLISESLEKEKSDLMHAIDDIRLQVARAKATIDEQEIQLSKSECDAAVLRHGLEAAKKIEELSKSELASEKKRSAILESHIQNSARNQTRQLLLIREDQRKLIESFASGIQCFSEESTASNDAILSEVRTCADRLCTSVETLGEKCNSERMEVQDFTNTIHDAISHLDTVSTQFTSSVESSTMSNAKVSERVQESLNLIERRLDADSTLLQQLENCESSYKSLNGRFATIEPTLNTLNTSVNSLTTTESSLLGDLNGFCKQLAEAQVQPPKAGLELELSNKFAENTQLQLRLQKISLEAESLRQGLGERESQTLVLQQSLAEATAECQNLETRNHRIETEKLAMQGEATLVEQRIRHEFTAEKSIATDSIRNEYEQRLEALQKEKNDLESGSEILVQLGGVRDFLIEAKRIVDDQRRGREALGEEAEQQIRQLTASYSEAMAKMDLQTMQIEQYQQVETTSTIEKSDLREQLKHAQEKNQELQRALALPDGKSTLQELSPNIVPFAAFENRMSPDQDTSPYDDPADFAMLFITDESAAPSPIAKPTKSPVVKVKSSLAKKDLPRPVKDETRIFDLPENLDQQEANRKRKSIDADAVPSRKASGHTFRTISGSMQTAGGPEDHPNKSSKHVHKFTYSRVHTTATKIQQEQFTVPARPPTIERRTSPKGLVSASSGNHPASIPNTRSRGRRRSRTERYDARFSQEG